MPAALLIEQVVTGVSTGAIYAIVALGYNLIFGVLNIFTFAHGSLAMIGSYGALLIIFMLTGSFWYACIFGVVAAAGVGLAIERVAVRPMKGNPWTVAIATFGAAIFVDNVVSRIATPVPRLFPRPFDVSFFPFVGGAEISNLQILLAAISVGLVAAMVFFVRKTGTGKAIRVVAQSPTLAKCVGIDVQRITVITFVIASGLGGAAGVLDAVTYGSTYPFIGTFLGLKGIVVLIVAGLGNMPGCLVVGIILGVLESLSVGLGSSSYRDFVAYGGLTIILLVRPTGLFGEVGRVNRD